VEILQHRAPRVNPQWVIAISFVFLCVFWIAIRLPTAAQALSDADGGHQLAGALQILHNEHPFVDFEATYGPFTFYASALAQIIFGQRFIGEIILCMLGYVIAYVILALSIYQITRKTGLAFFFGILALFAIPRLYKYYLVLGPVLTLWFAWYYINKPKLGNIFWLALAVTLAGLFRSDFGVYCTIAATVAVVLQPSCKAGGLKRALILWGEIILLALPYLLFLAFKGGLGHYFSDMLVGGPNIARGMSLPFPAFRVNQSPFSVGNLTFMATLFFFCSPLVALFFGIVKWKHLEETERKMLLTATVLCAFSLIQASVRFDYPHLLQAIPLAFPLAAWMANRLWGKVSPSFQKSSIVYLFFLLSLCAAVSIPAFLSGQNGWPAISLQGIPEKIRQYSLPKDQMLANADRDSNFWYAETMQYIRRCTTGEQRLMALPILTTFYYFTDRSFGGGQIGIISGYFVTPSDQERIITKMKQQDIPLIVYVPDLVFDGLPQRKLEVSAPAVAGYIQANYRLVKKVGQASLSLRRDLKIEKQAGTLNDFSCPVLQP
jgi:hypothetical protein